MKRVSSPLAEYRDRLRLRTATQAELAVLDARFATLRLLTFGAFALAAVLAWRDTVSGWWVLLPIALFIVLIRRHDAVIRRRVLAERAIAFYERGLARLEDRWHGGGEGGERFIDDEHLYANDLDLFGHGSLFELLSLARTRAGEETLAAWLKSPATPAEIGARREAVEELTPALDLRERVALAGADVRAGVHGEALVGWAEAAPAMRASWPRWVAAVLSLCAVGSAGWWGTTGDAGPFVIVVFLEILFSTPLRKVVDTALHAAEGPARDLDILAHVLHEIETQRFRAPRLRALQESLQTGGVTASVAIRRLHRLVELHDWQHNPFFALIAAAVLWGTQIGFAIEHWRRAHGVHVATWLRAVAEFEALGSLAAYHYERPADPFPDILNGGGAVYDGTALGHPLLPDARMVRNDVRLDAAGTRLLIVSGSNMSGKSTMLRTIGINAVLAFAGAPVRARALRLTPLSLGATLRIQDSLQEGRSRFYAEITRLRQIADRAGGTPPLLFLLDELFHGTNSHDRLVGASGVLRSLIARGAIGLVTTHDLALTAVADRLAHAANVHFEDQFEGGEIHFDYRMKPGPVTRSNAIALMRAVGLDVEQGVPHE